MPQQELPYQDLKASGPERLACCATESAAAATPRGGAASAMIYIMFGYHWSCVEMYVPELLHMLVLLYIPRNSSPV